GNDGTANVSWTRSCGLASPRSRRPSMPTLIRLQGGRMVLANDAFTHVADDQDLPPGDVIVSLTRFQADGERLLSEGRSVGVRLEAGEEAEALVYDLPRLSLVALAYPKFRDGRQYSNAR